MHKYKISKLPPEHPVNSHSSSSTERIPKQVSIFRKPVTTTTDLDTSTGFQPSEKKDTFSSLFFSKLTSLGITDKDSFNLFANKESQRHDDSTIINNYSIGENNADRNNSDNISNKNVSLRERPDTREGYNRVEAREGYNRVVAREGYNRTEAREGYNRAEAIEGYKGVERREGYNRVEGNKGVEAREGNKGLETREGYNNRMTIGEAFFNQISDSKEKRLSFFGRNNRKSYLFKGKEKDCELMGVNNNLDHSMIGDKSINNTTTTATRIVDKHGKKINSQFNSLEQLMYDSCLAKSIVNYDQRLELGPPIKDNYKNDSNRKNHQWLAEKKHFQSDNTFYKNIADPIESNNNNNNNNNNNSPPHNSAAKKQLDSKKLLLLLEEYPTADSSSSSKCSDALPPKKEKKSIKRVNKSVEDLLSSKRTETGKVTLRYQDSKRFNSDKSNNNSFFNKKWKSKDPINNSRKDTLLSDNTYKNESRFSSYSETKASSLNYEDKHEIKSNFLNLFGSGRNIVGKVNNSKAKSIIEYNLSSSNNIIIEPQTNDSIFSKRIVSNEALVIDIKQLEHRRIHTNGTQDERVKGYKNNNISVNTNRADCSSRSKEKVKDKDVTYITTTAGHNVEGSADRNYSAKQRWSSEPFLILAENNLSNKSNNETNMDCSTFGIDPSLYLEDPLSQMGSLMAETEFEDGNVGRLWFAVQYNAESERLLVSLIQLKNLPSRVRGVSNACDPFVRVYLTPDQKRHLQSQTKKKTCNPKFDETFIFQVSVREVKDRSVKFTVLDVDRNKSHVTIGHVIYPLSSHIYERSDDKSVMWRDLTREIDPDHVIDFSEKSQLYISLSYNCQLERLNVGVYAGKHFAAKSEDRKNSSFDLYVKVSLNRMYKCLKSRQSDVIKACKDQPKFNEMFRFKLEQGSVDSVSLSVQVMLRRHAIRDQSLGRIVLGSFMFARGPELEHWNEMLAKEKEQISRWHTLSD